MPVIVGNTTVNTTVAGTTLTANVPQSYQEYNPTRNSIMPSLRLDFVNSNVLDPRITFTRASNATYFNNAGVLTTAASNVPRFDYNPSTLVCNGLLIEQASTNLVYPSIITSSWYTDATITTNATVAPDNTTTGSKLIPNTTLGQWAAWTNWSTALGTTYTLSCYAKTNGYPRLWLLATDFSGNGFGATFDLSTGVFVSSTTSGVSTYISSTINYGGNGWYRCSITGIPNISNALATALYVDNGSGNYFTGDGTSGIQIWGAQLEQTAFPTSYIATTGATATRAADQASMTGINFSSWYNSSQGTLLTNYNVPAVPSNFATPSEISSGSEANAIEFFLYNSNTNYVSMKSGSTTYISQSIGTYVVNSVNKTIFAYANGSQAGVLNAGAVSTWTYTTLPVSPTQLNIGSSTFNQGYLNGWIQLITYYPTSLSNAELISLTS